MLNKKLQRRLTDSIRKSPSILCEGSILTGNLAGDDDFVIYGSVNGACDLAASLMLQKTGRWVGKIEAENIVIAGKVDGDVTAKNKLELTSTARVTGDITGKIIAIAEGAVIEGHIHMENRENISRFEERRGAVKE